jgi:hypothetical protein
MAEHTDPSGLAPHSGRASVESVFAALTQLGAELDAATTRRCSALCYELLLVLAEAACGLLTPERLPERLDRAVKYAMAHLRLRGGQVQ